ncbi:deoxynucleotidyltransferase terminal-interacting protein 1 [Centruroides vittatus]|uniref:deoxynucleotidyltransferase terminal-interacting protein 1 n=1 Tax=Centruroides vittatus TaxID=120091 RepID=UPI00350F84A0
MNSSIPEIRIYSPEKVNNGGGALNGKVDNVRKNPFFCDMRKIDVKSIPMVKWENTAHMRTHNLSNFSASTLMYRTAYRSQGIAMNRAKLGCISSPIKSLDLLRQNLQTSINKEIDEIIQRYLEKFFKPGLENIRANNGENSVSEHHVHGVCKQILEEAKKMYQGSHTRGNSPAVDCSDVEYHSPPEIKPGRTYHKGPGRKRKDSDTDSEASQNLFKPKKKKGRPPIHFHSNMSGRSTPSKLKSSEPVKREGPKWDPARLTPETQFIMGAKANKALGLGATRGRLYIKHPDIFKYSGDQEDKQWLYDQNQMPATGGKAYMLLVEDIRQLAESEEYRNNPGLMMDEIIGFSVPDSMLQKMKISMQLMRTDVPTRKRGRPPLNIDTSSERNNIQVEQKQEEVIPEDRRQAESAETSPADLDLLSTEMPSNDPSPFSLGPGFDDISPAQPEVSPTPSEFSTSIDPPLSAPFDITTP